jgi:hypothetical protein
MSVSREELVPISRLMGLTDASQRLGVSTGALKAWIAAGKIRGWMTQLGRVVDADDVARLAAARHPERQANTPVLSAGNEKPAVPPAGYGRKTMYRVPFPTKYTRKPRTKARRCPKCGEPGDVVRVPGPDPYQTLICRPCGYEGAWAP